MDRNEHDDIIERLKAQAAAAVDGRQEADSRRRQRIVRERGVRAAKNM